MSHSPHPTLDLLIALTGGFFASFLTFVTATIQSSPALRSQLLAGGPALNKDAPTTLNTIHTVMDGNDPILTAMSSYAWWIIVIAFGLVAAFVILKFMRRYA